MAKSVGLGGRTAAGDVATTGTEVSKRRRIAFTVLAVVATLLYGGLFFGIPALVTGWFDDYDQGVHKVHSMGWGVLGGILLTGAWITQIRPRDRAIAPLQQFALGFVAIIVAGLVSGELGELLFPIAITGAILALGWWLHPMRDEFLRFDRARASGTLLAMAGAGAIALLIYAFDQWGVQRNPPPDDVHGGHWADMGLMALLLALTALLGALRTPGWRVPVWCAGLGAIVFGVASIIFNDIASSVGRIGGIVAVVAGIAFIAEAEWEARQSAGSSLPHEAREPGAQPV